MPSSEKARPNPPSSRADQQQHPALLPPIPTNRSSSTSLQPRLERGFWLLTIRSQRSIWSGSDQPEQYPDSGGRQQPPDPGLLQADRSDHANDEQGQESSQSHSGRTRLSIQANQGRLRLRARLDWRRSGPANSGSFSPMLRAMNER